MDNSYEEIEPSDKKKVTKFQSPIPTLVRLRNVLLGKTKPDIYTRVTFYINLFIWITFMLWNFIGYFAIASRSLIFEMKKISVETIIQNRGIELGFDGDDFVTRLAVVHGVGILCWGVIFLGLVLLYRKRKQFVFFVVGGVIFYVGMNIFYLSFQFFREDTTSYDKIALLVMLASCIIHATLMSNERRGGSISFFGEAEDEED